MGKPAARIGDMHMCPMVTPGVPPIPHVGGPIIGPGVPNVLIGGMPAATMGDMCTCVGPPDTIVLGSTGVFIGGKPAARMGDQCAHGGAITIGMPTVLIGEASGGSVSSIALMPLEILLEMLEEMPIETKSTMNQAATFQQAANNGTVFIPETSICPSCGVKLNEG